MAFWTDRLHPAAAAPALPDLRPLLAYLAACLLLVVPMAFQGPAGRPSATVISARIDEASGAWRAADLAALTLPRGRVSTLKLRLWVDPAMARSGEPLGLYLSGVFAADARWNGVAVGAKGRPGASRAEEQPDRVDKVLPLPTRLVRPGENELTLRMSASYLAHPVHTVIHGQGGLFGLRVAPFSAEVRRPIGYYAAPFLMLGVLALALAALALRGQARSAGGAILAGLTVAALAEVSRSVLNYPYPLHDLRMIPISLAASLTAGAIVLHAGKVAGLKAAPRLGRILAPLAVLAAAVNLMLPDHQVLAAGAAVGAGLAGWGALRRREGALELAAALGLMFACAALDLGDFMDRGLYAAAAPLVAHLVWPRRVLPAPAPAPPEPAPERLAVGPAEARRFVALADIRAIQGAGDYAELRLKSGQRLLHLETLQALAARLPERFFRTHRSHIVNLDEVEALAGAGGGRYRVRLSDGALVPVSRTHVAELRKRLGA